jgi:hypothetical protein
MLGLEPVKQSERRKLDQRAVDRRSRTITAMSCGFDSPEVYARRS